MTKTRLLVVCGKQPVDASVAHLEFKAVNYDPLIYNTGSIIPGNFSLTVYLVVCDIQVCQVSLELTLIFCSYSKKQIFEKRGTFD